MVTGAGAAPAAPAANSVAAAPATGSRLKKVGVRKRQRRDDGQQNRIVVIAVSTGTFAIPAPMNIMNPADRAASPIPSAGNMMTRK